MTKGFPITDEQQTSVQKIKVGKLELNIYFLKIENKNKTTIHDMIEMKKGFHLTHIKLSDPIDNILMEGTVSKNIDLGLSLYFKFVC